MLCLVLTAALTAAFLTPALADWGDMLRELFGAFSSEARLDELLRQYDAAETLDERLKAVRRIAEEHAGEISERNYLGLYNADAGLPEGLIPSDWSEYPFTVTDGFPEEAGNRPCIVLWDGDLAASLLVRFPAEMIAASLDEVEYAVVITQTKVKSNYNYTPSAVSYHYVFEAWTDSAPQ